jgi:hypothetical protein
MSSIRHRQLLLQLRVTRPQAPPGHPTRRDRRERGLFAENMAAVAPSIPRICALLNRKLSFVFAKARGVTRHLEEVRCMGPMGRRQPRPKRASIPGHQRHCHKFGAISVEFDLPNLRRLWISRCDRPQCNWRRPAGFAVRLCIHLFKSKSLEPLGLPCGV